jgi:type III secretion protein R
MLLMGILALIPLLVMVTTCFLKFVIVLTLTRNALGVQQVPPTIALQGIALAMTLFVMSPTFSQIGQNMFGSKVASGLSDVANVEMANNTAMPSVDYDFQNNALGKGIKHLEPLRQFMLKHVKPDQQTYFLDAAKRIWPKEVADKANPKDFVILIPAFVVSELQVAFEIGFLIFLPFVIIDLVVSNILMALGMQQVSPNTVTMPLKIFLFVMVDGWGKMIHGLMTSYV